MRGRARRTLYTASLNLMASPPPSTTPSVSLPASYAWLCHIAALGGAPPASRPA